MICQKKTPRHAESFALTPPSWVKGLGDQTTTPARQSWNIHEEHHFVARHGLTYWNFCRHRTKMGLKLSPSHSLNFLFKVRKELLGCNYSNDIKTSHIC